MSSEILFTLILIVVAILAMIRGWEVGGLRQLLSTAGFIAGFIIGILIQPYIINFAHTTNGRALLALVTTMGFAFVFLTIGEYIGLKFKSKIHYKKANQIDGFVGSIISFVTVVFSIWLLANILSSIAIPGIQSFVQKSPIIKTLNEHLPSAPTIISSFGSLIDPNGFPKVFIGSEKIPANVTKSLPNLGALRAAVDKDARSVVKVEGLGCGGLVEGSGFVIGSNLVATNAHVVAGIDKPVVIDSNGTHSTKLIWFDPNLDFAILQTNNLAGGPLVVDTKIAPDGTIGGALGYPGGGSFSVSPSLVIDEFTATGRNIYGKGSTNRSIYEIKSNIIPGNSGGPLVETNGDVIGMIFAASTTYNRVGYALTANQLVESLKLAEAQGTSAQSSGCVQ